MMTGQNPMTINPETWFWTFIAETRAASPDGHQAPARPDDEDLLAWYRDGLAHLLEVVTAADPTAPVSASQREAFRPATVPVPGG